MKTVQEYLQALTESGEDAFASNFTYPFLLYPEKHGQGDFQSYHTRMANRGDASSLAGAGKPISDYRVLAPEYDEGKQVPSKLLVGRSEDRALTIDHSTVSKRHAFIALDSESGLFRLGDAGSTNGTFLNGKCVDSGEPVFIRDGNVVSFGDCDYLFFTPDGFLELLKRLREK